MEWVVSTVLWPLCPPETLGTHCVVGWVGLWGRYARARKILPPAGFDSRIVHRVETMEFVYVIFCESLQPVRITGDASHFFRRGKERILRYLELGRVLRANIELNHGSQN